MSTSPVAIYNRISSTVERLVPTSILLLSARLGVAGVFFMSGRTKVEGLLTITPATYELFRTDYKLPLVPPVIAAHVAAYSETLFPILLVLGLFTRFSALWLFGMTSVIEIFVYPDAWPTHGTWAVCFLVVIARGPGLFSLDHLIARKLSRA